MSTTTTPEGMEVGGSTVPTLQIGGPGYGFPCNTKPSMDLNPAVAHLIGRRPGRGGGGFGGGSVRPLGQSQNSNGVSARRIQEALISNRLAQAVGELATIQIRDVKLSCFDCFVVSNFNMSLIWINCDSLFRHWKRPFSLGSPVRTVLELVAWLGTISGLDLDWVMAE